MSKVTISLRIDEKLHDLLKASSKKFERSISATVRLALKVAMGVVKVKPSSEPPAT